MANKIPTPADAGAQKFVEAGQLVANNQGVNQIAEGVQEVGGKMGQFFSTDYSNLPGLGGAPNISDGTNDLEDEANLNNQNLNNDIADTETGAGTIQSQLTELSSLRDNIGKMTDEDLKAIEAAGAEAGAQFDESIAEAKESRKTEMARGIVRAGQAGGFESTQLAGTAAVLPTDPRTGEAFVGAGGKLSAQRQILDRNISSLKAAQQRAIAAAKAAQREYIRTGKRQDYSDAVDAVKLANELKMDAENMSIKKDQLMLSKQGFALDVAKEGRLAEESAAQEARLQERLNLDINKFMAGEDRLNRNQALVEAKFAQDVSETTRTNTLESIANMAKGKVNIDELTDEQKIDLEAKAGLIPGSLDAFYAGLLRDVENGETLDALDIKKKQADINNVYNTISNRNASAARAAAAAKKKEEEEVVIPSIEEFANTYSKVNQVSIDPEAPEVKSVYDDYVTEIKMENIKFTSDEEKRLAQAGLLNSDKQTQLDYLFSEDEDDDEDLF